MIKKITKALKSTVNFFNVKRPIDKKPYLTIALVYAVICVVASICYKIVPNDIVALVISVLFIFSKWFFGFVNAKRFYHIFPNLFCALLILFASYYFFKYIIVIIIASGILCLIPGKFPIVPEVEEPEEEEEEEKPQVETKQEG